MWRSIIIGSDAVQTEYLDLIAGSEDVYKTTQLGAEFSLADLKAFDECSRTNPVSNRLGISLFKTVIW